MMAMAARNRNRPRQHFRLFRRSLWQQLGSDFIFSCCILGRTSECGRRTGRQAGRQAGRAEGIHLYYYVVVAGGLRDVGGGGGSSLATTESESLTLSLKGLMVCWLRDGLKCAQAGRQACCLQWRPFLPCQKKTFYETDAPSSPSSTWHP